MSKHRRKRNDTIELIIAAAGLLGMIVYAKPTLLHHFLIAAVVIVVGLAIVLYLGPIKQRRRFIKRKEPQFATSGPSLKSGVDAIDTLFAQRGEEGIPHTSWSMALIEALEWKRFETLCAAYYRAIGYRAQVTRNGADGGIDINLYRASYSDSKPFAVAQCKAWKNRVGIKPVRELYGVMTAENALFGVFLTAGEFTSEAINFSQGKKLKLLTGRELLAEIHCLPKEEQQKLLVEITAGDYTTPSCPSCGDKMVLRTSGKDGSKFWGCRHYPRCNNTFRYNSR